MNETFKVIRRLGRETADGFQMVPVVLMLNGENITGYVMFDKGESSRWPGRIILNFKAST